MPYPLLPKRFGLRSEIWPLYTTHGQQRALLDVIRSATELRWNLSRALTAYANDETGVQCARIRRLAQLLQDGVPLADAVDQVPAVISESARLAIRVGSQSGTLNPMLCEASVEPFQAREMRLHLRQTAVYLLLVASVIGLIWTFQVVKIAPKLRTIVVESGVPDPGTDWATSVTQGLVPYWPVILLLLATLVWYALSGRLLHSLSRGGLAPLIGRTLPLRSAEVLRFIAVVKEAGRPVTAAISSMAKHHDDPAMRQRLLYVRNELEQGSNAWIAMRQVGLIGRSESQLLESADAVGNTPWALRQVAQRKERVATRRFAVAVEFIRVVIILLLGAIVLSFAFGTWGIVTGLPQSIA